MKHPPDGKWRCEILFGLLLLAVVGLCVRLSLLVARGPADAPQLALTQQRMVVPLPARPGGIYARSGDSYVPLALSKQVPSCYADPSLLRDDELADTAIGVADVLGLDPRDVLHELVTRRRKRFAWLGRQISLAQAEAIRSLGMPAVGIIHEWRREYPSGTLAATVIGFRRRDGEPGGGLELSQQKYLGAQDGRRVMLADARRRPIHPLPDDSRPPRDGDNVFLCLDAVIQGFLQEAVAESVERFDAQWGTGIVVDPHTGEVLAMCSVPTFDPNAYNTTPADSMTNRAITMPFEPGSAFKPIIAAAAVDAGVVTYDTKIFCENGVYRARRHGRITDHGHRYGTLTVTYIVVKSSNIGMAKIGEMLKNPRLHATLKRFGFGAKTGVSLAGESGGIVRPLRKWDGYSLWRVPFGQEISATALQMTMAFSSLVNGGLLLQPRLIEKVTDSQGRVLWQGRRRVVRRVLRPDTSKKTLEVLRQVVEQGTGKACRMDKWTSFGKTGTAQIPGRGGYVDGAYTGTFIGGAPASRPRVICMISVYWPDRSKGYYGSKVAAPYVRDVLERSLGYLNVPPDKPTRP